MDVRTQLKQVKNLFRSKLEFDVFRWRDYYQKEFEKRDLSGPEMLSHIQSCILKKNTTFNNLQLVSRDHILLANLAIVDFSNNILNLSFNSSKFYDDDPRISGNNSDLFYTSIYNFKKRGGKLNIVYDKKNRQFEHILQEADKIIVLDKKEYSIIPFTISEESGVWYRFDEVKSIYYSKDDFIFNLLTNLYFSNKN